MLHAGVSNARSRDPCCAVGGGAVGSGLAAVASKGAACLGTGTRDYPSREPSIRRNPHVSVWKYPVVMRESKTRMGGRGPRVWAW